MLEMIFYFLLIFAVIDIFVISLFRIYHFGRNQKRKKNWRKYIKKNQVSIKTNFLNKKKVKNIKKSLLITLIKVCIVIFL